MANDAPVWISIIVAGFIAGMIFAIGLNTGISPDEGGVSVFILESVCEVVEESEDGGAAAFNCGIIIPLFFLVTVILGVVAIAAEASQMQDWRFGLALYVTGWISGLLYILMNT